MQDIKDETENINESNNGPIQGAVITKQLIRNITPGKSSASKKEMVVLRPTTPEEQKKKCLNCANMEDFVKGL